MNKLIEISDAGDAYVFRTRLYVSFNVPKAQIDAAKADIVNLALKALSDDVADALKRAAKQVPKELAALREAEAAAAKEAKAA